MRKILFAAILSIMFILSACSGKNLNVKNTESTGQVQNTQNTTAPAATKEEKKELQEKLTVSDFFPLKKNVHMKYKGTGNEYAEYETYVDYVNGSNIMQVRNLNPGTVSVNVYEIKNGELRKLYSRGETYYRYDYTLMKKDDEILIKEPIKTGTSWKLKNGAERSITALDKSITTPSGTYKALEITTKDDNSTVNDYYVKGIGLVKTVFKSNSDNNAITSELETIENDVPLKQNISFYFPDFLNDRIVYINREVKMLTNEDIKYKFQKELKTIPDKSNISKVLTPGVKINKISLDDKKDLVSVDFTSELTGEMNAGSTFEAMVLKSITNTLGVYYQKRNVEITVNSKPYSSGHIMMKAGEYFKVDTSGITEYK